MMAFKAKVVEAQPASPVGAFNTAQLAPVPASLQNNPHMGTLLPSGSSVVVRFAVRFTC
jgi:hypothetical protein